MLHDPRGERSHRILAALLRDGVIPLPTDGDGHWVGLAQRLRVEVLAAVRHRQRRCLRCASVPAEDRDEAVDLVRLPIVRHLRNSVVPQAEHSEGLLRASLPVRHLVLEVRDAQEEVRVLSNVQDLLQVACLVDVRAVVLCNVHRCVLEGLVVVVEEHVRKVLCLVLGVEAVCPPRLEGLGDVVPWHVAVLRGIEHRVFQLSHLPQSRVALEPAARAADCEREGRCEVDAGALDADLLLCVEHRVEGADDGLAHHGHSGVAASSRGGRHLQIRLVDDAEVGQGRVVRLVLGQKA
mmetsp:Transcript_176640/g.429708  ORF Transcript_176640/g.429708 Transcript_176640/m.429708 type:complete len:294 (+) Transcript_176640:872-1753(+)